ncbi:hypothetical protein [Hymenobacter sp. BT491]|uniref:TapB family protein n=1 Tax=Hymenobacter sp. BT491 TaxID=2766779 RepID=UPI00165399AD|nr:hypothetical protein [Hymenobacter sp. BT491]MBC6990092.1 hypothetical protein [Hymenobacter sp. BT491]
MPRPRSFRPLVAGFALTGAVCCTKPATSSEQVRAVSEPVAAHTPQAALPTAVDCAHPFGLSDNMEVVYEIRDAAGKPAGQVHNRVVRPSTDTSKEKKQTVTLNNVLLKSGTYDEKNKLLHLQDLTFFCRRDTSFTDGMAQINYDALKSFRDRRLAYTPVPLAWPNQPTVGSQLPSGGVTIDVSSSVVAIAKVYTTLRNRRVVSGPEKISTPAGTFECYRVEAEREQGTAPHADLVLRSVGRVIDYYAPAVGIVKTEVYNKNNKLEQTLTLVSRSGGQ